MKRPCIVLATLALVGSAACSGSNNSDGGSGGPNVDKPETFAVPSEYISGPFNFSYDPDSPGINPSDLPGKWLASSGTTIQVYQSGSGSYNYYSQDSMGDLELYVFYPGGNYHLNYVFNITTGLCHSSAWASEIGNYEISADRTSLTLKPSELKATYCGCGAATCAEEKKSSSLPTRAYVLFSTTITPFSEEFGSGTNNGVMLKGPCADFMFQMDSKSCTDDKGNGLPVVYQRVN